MAETADEDDAADDADADADEPVADACPDDEPLVEPDPLHAGTSTVGGGNM